MLGVAAGALAAVVVHLALGELRTDPVEEVLTGYRLSDADALAPGPVSLVSVRDARQPSSITGFAAPTGDRYVSVVVAIENDLAGDTVPDDDWIDLETLDLAVHAVDGSGEREELVPTDRSRLTLDGIGGQVRRQDPYWIRLSYEPASVGVEHYEVDLRLGDDEYTLIARTEESA